MSVGLHVEQAALERIPESARHGTTRDTGVLWAAANLGLPPWAIGVLAVGLGLGLPYAVVAVVVGNVIGAALLAFVSALGPEHGRPAIVLPEQLLGRVGLRLTAFLNAVSCLGWYAVNAVLGGEALAKLLNIPLLPALVLLTLGLGVVTFIGHDLVHRVEAMAGVLLALLFLLMLVRLLLQHGPVPPAAGFSLGAFLLTLAIVASYLFSWSPYATDYSRYLPMRYGRGDVFWATFWGSFGATTGVELMGVLAAVFFGTHGTPIDILTRAMGNILVVPALVAVVLGTVTANALNAYTGSLSSIALGLSWTRPAMTATFGLLGGALAYLGAHGFSGNYENFLLLLSYWVAPWLGILLAATWWPNRPVVRSPAPGRLFLLFLVSIAATIPFMDQTLYEGPVAKLLGGGDIGYWVGLLVAFFGTRLLLRAGTAGAKGTGALRSEV